MIEGERTPGPGGSDYELYQRAIAGCRESWRILTQRHYEGIRRFFVNKVVDQAEAFDLIHDTFEGCFRSRGFRGDSLFRTYLYGIATNVLRRYYRAKTRRRCDPFHSSVHAMSPPVSPVSYEDLEEVKVLFAALRRIPLEAQILLEAYYWENLKTPELAQILQLPQPTVRRRLADARRMLRACIEKLPASIKLKTNLELVLSKWDDSNE